jgi:hypothetical protein
MPSPSVWQDRAVIRFSVSSWRTGAEEVAQTIVAVERAAAVRRGRVFEPARVG